MRLMPFTATGKRKTPVVPLPIVVEVWDVPQLPQALRPRYQPDQL